MTDPHACDEQSFEQIEAAIRAAGDYIRPSEDLRPRTLEAAREDCGLRRAEQKLAALAIVALMLVTVASPVVHYIDALRRQTSAPSASELQLQGLRYASDPRIGPNWGLAEAFTQLRRVQADRLGRSGG